MENDSKSDNIVIGPWAGSTKKSKNDKISEKDKLSSHMDYIDKVAEKVMVQVIHTLNESGVNISSKEFIRHVGFLDECVKSIIYNDINYDHPLTELVRHLVGATKSKDHDKVFTSFRGDKMIEILEFINGDNDE